MTFELHPARVQTETVNGPHFQGSKAAMAKGEQKGNKEARKPKAVKPKTTAAAPSQKPSPPAKGK
jgi:hypothetical protein